MRVVDVGGSYQANFADDKKTTVADKIQLYTSVYILLGSVYLSNV